ncbi:hypothetical protein VTL71DRAFT_8947 [Oculimacula yallundae]|uniref:Uncharacterized protein n=1 Tax=Oculimacula yallundae TaxID=86028 RepID=A0ABR4BTC1_9HELO
MYSVSSSRRTVPAPPLQSNTSDKPPAYIKRRPTEPPPPSYSIVGPVHKAQTQIENLVKEESSNPGPPTCSSSDRPQGVPEYVWITVPFWGTFDMNLLLQMNQQITNTRYIRFEIAIGVKLGYITYLGDRWSGDDPELKKYKLTNSSQMQDPRNPCWDQKRENFHLQHFVKQRTNGEWA